MIINTIQESCMHLFQINLLVNYYISHLKICCFEKSEFSYIEVWFIHQNSKAMVIEDKIKISLVIN